MKTGTENDREDQAWRILLRATSAQSRRQGCGLAVKAGSVQAKVELELALIREFEPELVTELSAALEQLRAVLGRELTDVVRENLRRNLTAAPAGRIAAVIGALRRLNSREFLPELSGLFEAPLAPIDLASLLGYLPRADPAFEPMRAAPNQPASKPTVPKVLPPWRQPATGPNNVGIPEKFQLL